MKKLYILMLTALMGVVSVQAAWEGGGSAVKQVGGTYYVLYEDGPLEVGVWAGTPTSLTLDLSGPGSQLSFEARRNMRTAIGTLRVSDGYSILYDENPGYDYAAKGPFDINIEARQIEFLEHSASYKKLFKDIRVTMAQYLEAPSKNNVNFGSADYNTDPASQTLTVAWCNVPAMTYEITGDDKGRFEVEVANNAQAGKYNTATYTVRYKHDVLGTHSAYLVIRDSYGNYTKSINLSGETKKLANTITWNLTDGWKDWNETIELTASSNNAESELVYSFSNTDIISVEGSTVTFLEAGAGQEVKITVSQAATEHYLAATSVTKTLFIKRQQEVIWDSEKVNTNLRLNGARDINGYAYPKYTTEKAIVYSSANADIVSVSGTTLTPLALGEVEIIASIDGDEQNRPAESRKTFVIREKESVVVTQGGAIIEENGVWTLHLEEHSGVIASNNTAETLEIAIGDASVARYNSETQQIEALALGQTTLTLRQAATEEFNAYENIVTLKVERKVNTLAVAAEAYEQYVDDEVEGVIVASSLNSDGEITASSTDMSIAYYDVEDELLYFPNSNNKVFEQAKVTITIRQAQTETVAAAEKTIVLTVKKHANALYVNGKETFNETIETNSTIEEVEFSALNEDYENSPIACEQLSGASVATYANGVITSNFRAGNAEWRISQAESRTHLAAKMTFNVRVIRAGEATDCYVLDDPTEYSWGTYGEANYELTEAGSLLTYEIMRSAIMGVSDNLAWQMKYSADGSNWEEKSLSVSDRDTWVSFTMPISEDIRYIKFESVFGAGGNHAVRNVKVTRLTYLNAQNGAISTNEKQEGMAMLTGAYSLANGGDLTIKSDNPKFTFGEGRAAVYTIKDVDCTGGKISIPVYYLSNEPASDEANIDIYNGVYNTTVHFTAEAKELPKTYGEYEATFCEGDSVEYAGTWYYEATETPVEVVLEDANMYGGDSIVSLTVTVHKKGYSELYAVQTVGEYFEMNYGPWYLRDSEEIVTEHTVTKADTAGLWFTQHLTTTAGCDSIVKYIIAVNLLEPVELEKAIAFCDGDSAEYRGKWYYVGGEDKLEIEDAVRDTIIYVHVTVYTPDDEVLYETVTAGETLQLPEGEWLLGETVVSGEYATTDADVPELVFVREGKTTEGCSIQVELVVTVQERTPTGMQQVAESASAEKVLRDGVLYIRRKGTNFTITGIKVQ